MKIFYPGLRIITLMGIFFFGLGISQTQAQTCGVDAIPCTVDADCQDDSLDVPCEDCWICVFDGLGDFCIAGPTCGGGSTVCGVDEILCIVDEDCQDPMLDQPCPDCWTCAAQGDGSSVCVADCTPECGNGTQEAGEQCDNGANNSDTVSDACRTNCQLPTCGDQVTDSGEACDNGANNSDAESNACRLDCTLPVCGDGVVDSGEACDGGEDCGDNCQVIVEQVTPVPPTCVQGSGFEGNYDANCQGCSLKQNLISQGFVKDYGTFLAFALLAGLAWSLRRRVLYKAN